mmetsp:Transcript_38939/g.111271  ORF Transcript_38939/g.111271 Transcript_38939/m.111271 type:complete len:247 (-) Transcript_38939:1487-2227(-)
MGNTSSAPGDEAAGLAHQMCGCQRGDEPELSQALLSGSAWRVTRVLTNAPQLVESPLLFEGNAKLLAALEKVMQRKDISTVKALLEAGISPNAPLAQPPPPTRKRPPSSTGPVGSCTGGTEGDEAGAAAVADMSGEDAGVGHVPMWFQHSCRVPLWNIFVLMLDHGADPECGLVAACLEGSADMVKMLLVKGANPDRIREGRTPLSAAVESEVDRHRKVELLLQHGADPNSPLPDESSPPLLMKSP